MKGQIHMKKTKNLFTSLALSVLMAVQPIACYAVEEKPETYSYTFDAYVVDMDNNNALVGGIEARLVEYEFDIDSEYYQTGERLRTIAEWTTSDTEHEYITCEDVNPDCVYILEIDELPENYNYQGKGYVRRHDFGDSLPKLPYNPFKIQLENQPPYEIWEDFPITKTAEWNVYFRDYMSMAKPDIPVEYIKGIDFEIARMTPDENGGFTPVETIGKWNTSETDSITFTTEETFNSTDDIIYFGFKYNHVPEEYEKALYMAGIDYEFPNESCVFDGYYVYRKSGESVRTRNSDFYFTWKKSSDNYITTMPTNTTTTTATLSETKKVGDANGDNKLSIADSVLIMQALSNPNEFTLTPENVSSADVVDKGNGLTSMDALAIQMVCIDLLQESDLPVTSEYINSLIN